MSNVLGTLPPVAELCALPTTPARWRSSTPASSCRTTRPTCKRGTPTSSRSRATRCAAVGHRDAVGAEELLDAMPPFLGGGNMIDTVTFEGFTRAGAGEVRSGHASDRRSRRARRRRRLPRAIGMDAVRQHEMELTALCARHAQRSVRRRHHDLRPDDVEHRGGVISFAFRDLHPHDVSQVLDQHNVCVRAGHHCAKPLMKSLGVNATTRASLYLYNDRDDVDALADALDGATRYLRTLIEERDTMPGLEDLYREIILDHYRTPRNRGELESPPAVGVQRTQPTVRRRDHRVPARRRRRRQRHQDRRPGLFDLAVVGVDDVARRSRASRSPRSRALIRRFKSMMSIDSRRRRQRRRRPTRSRSAISRRCRAS